jgi:hypothetical protein
VVSFLPYAQLLSPAEQALQRPKGVKELCLCQEVLSWKHGGKKGLYWEGPRVGEGFTAKSKGLKG